MKWIERKGYRKLAFDSLPHKCDICGYDSVPDILEAHHVNFDHGDDRLHNLQILCPTCHRELHFMERGQTNFDADYEPEID